MKELGFLSDFYLFFDKMGFSNGTENIIIYQNMIK